MPNFSLNDCLRCPSSKILDFSSAVKEISIISKKGHYAVSIAA
jgi:hypothetical protein